MIEQIGSGNQIYTLFTRSLALTKSGWFGFNSYNFEMKSTEFLRMFLCMAPACSGGCDHAR